MTIDWFVLLTPLLLLALLLPFLFAGCGLSAKGTMHPLDATLEWEAAVFKTNDNNAISNQRIVTIVASWTFINSQLPSPPPPVTRTVSGAGSPPGPIFLGVDNRIRLKLQGNELGHNPDRINCSCALTFQGGATFTTAISETVPFTYGTSHVFELVRAMRPGTPIGYTPAPFHVIAHTVKN